MGNERPHTSISILHRHYGLQCEQCWSHYIKITNFVHKFWSINLDFCVKYFCDIWDFFHTKNQLLSKLEYLDQKWGFGTVCDLAHDSGQMATAKWQTKIKVEVMMILCVSSAKKNGFSGSTNGTYFPPPSVHISRRKKLAISRAYQLWSHFDSVEI